jgi:hypothetical protein
MAWLEIVQEHLMGKKTLFWLAFFVLTLFEAALLVYAQDSEHQTYTQVVLENDNSIRLTKF